MCGFVGFLGKKRDDSTVERMLQTQSYRGPDDSGVFVEEIASGYVHLGHNRLAIQDVSTQGHQPFVSACGEYIIVFNGEVYNFKSIRTELRELGHTFISKSDTEVILYAYKEWGMACLKKFIGMFAFSLLDKQQKKIYLVRDRAGVKPLYYYDDGVTFLFSSELKSFHAHTGFKKVLNKDALPYYFQMGYIPAPYSIYQNTYKLEAGHYLVYDLIDNSHIIEQYWSIDSCYEQEKFDKSESEILDDLEVLVEESVNLRMISDVPVGIFLSGGYDSSLVTALLAKNHRDLHTFTIGFEDKKYNEAMHAKEIASYLGTRHTEHYVTSKEMLAKLDTFAFYYDEPFGDSSALPTMMVSNLARKDVAVALSGDGGDEVFCGYSKYFFLEKTSSVFTNKFKKRLLQKTLDSVNSKVVGRLNALLPFWLQQTNIEDKYQKFKRAVNAGDFDEMFLSASSPVDANDVKDLLHIEASKEYFYAFEMNRKHSLLDEMMRIDYKTFMVDDVLTKVDRATMSVGLEGREPLLDHRIIEYMARVPVDIKYKNRQGKYLLRQILYKHLPQKLVNKPKAGFQVPLRDWLENDLKYLVEKYLDKDTIDDEIFDIEVIVGMKEEFFLGDYTHVHKIWFILMYEMWKEKWFG